MESGGGVRRRSHSGERIDSLNLRDFLRVRDDDEGHNSLAGLTLSAVLANEKRSAPAQVNRTLLDIIRDDPNSGFKNNKKSWRVFRDKLRLCRAGSAWISSLPVPHSDVPVQNNNRMIISRRNSTRFVNTDIQTQPDMSSPPAINNVQSRVVETNSLAGRLNHAIQRDGEAVETESSPEGEEEEVGGESPVRMSLMALLAETDREMGLDGSPYTMDDEIEIEEEEEEEEDHRGGGGGGGGYNNCCVCMVRHKGAAFIPCGHTFCRLCSREVWIQRGNCPLCNGFILEILDIF